jgi:hypothetical protein
MIVSGEEVPRLHLPLFLTYLQTSIKLIDVIMIFVE